MKNTKGLSTVAGILFAISAALEIITFVDGLLYNYYGGQNLINFVFSIGPILLALSMFQQNSKLCLFGATLQVLGNILSVKSIFDIYGSHLRIATLLWTLLNIIAWVLVILAVIKQKKQTMYCTMSAGLILFCFFTNKIYAVSAWGFRFELSGLFRQLLVILPVVLMGYIISNADFGCPPNTTVQRMATKKVDNESQFEKLTKLKGLLDSGIITQEEFDAKKKELLKL